MPAPRFRFSVPVMEASCGWAAAPLLHGGAAILGGGGGSFDAAGSTCEVALLQGVDLATGAIRFTRSVREGAGVIESSAPCEVSHRGEGLFAAAIADQFESTKLLVLDADGHLRHERLLGNDWPFVAYDLGFKLMLAVTARRPEEIVATWTYRQIREWGTAVVRIDAPGRSWTSAERCVGCARGVAVGVALPADAPTLVCRDLGDGRELGRVALGHEAVAALVTRDAVLVQDRAAQYAAYAAREEELTEHALQERLDVNEALRRIEAHPGLPAILRVLAARSGEEWFRHELPGDIVHIAALPVGAAVVASTPDGRGECLVLNRAGEVLARFPAPGRRLDRPWKGQQNETPRVLGASGGEILYAAGDTLLGIEMATGAPRWEMALPDGGVGFRPQIRERHLAQPDVACDGNVLAIRGAARLWVYDLGGA